MPLSLQKLGLLNVYGQRNRIRLELGSCWLKFQRQVLLLTIGLAQRGISKLAKHLAKHFDRDLRFLIFEFVFGCFIARQQPNRHSHSVASSSI